MPFLFGLCFMFLAMFQQTNSAHGRWRLAFVTNLAMGFFLYHQIHYATGGIPSFCLFQLGAAFGSAAGVFVGNRLK